MPKVNEQGIGAVRTNLAAPAPSENEGDMSYSDSEAQQALEVSTPICPFPSAAEARIQVVFNGESVKRRKASLTPNSAGQMPRRTSCFVHSLLRAQEKEELPEESMANESPPDKAPDRGPEDDHGLQSRHLTKTQLSDMALGIRELSKKLSHITVKLKVRRVFLLTKAHDITLIKHTREVAEWLLSEEREDKYTVYVEDTLEHNKQFDAEGLVKLGATSKERLKFWDNELCRRHPHLFDIALALGGDGTVLYASWLFQKVVPPVIPFALGSLGFLTRFDFGEFPQTLTKAFHDGITVNLRLRFEVTVMRTQEKAGHDSRDLIEELIGEEADDDYTHKPEISHDILNDLVIDRGPNPTMSSIELFGDDEHYTTLQADGICVATPTGSTAYNLAAGGSLWPIILPDTIVLRAGVPYDARAGCWASFDGKERIELRPGDYVTISASRYPFASVLPLERQREDWIQAISRTLNWNSRQRQKSFKD
ncbi:MAG: hypothetical protein M1821_000255 [Bathelium mastoideum]|nr:MAG: hypothetical protein M1821_000255 [Bathelium mastoideum]